MSFMQIPNYFNVLPVKDKIPQIPWKEFTERQQTAEERQDIYDARTHSVKLGIITGKVSKIIVLDDDGGLNVQTHPIPKTWTVKTPRGGTHYYFRWVPELDNKITTKVGIQEKVDVRGDGGYVVFYGFQHPFISSPLANPPKWLIDVLPNKERSLNDPVSLTSERMGLSELLAGIKEGNRNDSFTRAAGSLRARSYGIDEMMSLLSPKANEIGFSLHELRTICESVGRYKPRFELPTSGTAIDEFLKETEAVEWLVPDFIAKKSIGFVVGLPETGKTWMLIDLAVECAKGGGLWLNKFPVEKAKVLLIDQERFKGETQRRLRAVMSGKNLSASTLKSALFVKCGTSIRIDLQNSYDAFRKELAELRPELIIVDSFATFHTREENNRKDIQEVLERIKDIRNEFGCTFLFIHHENKFAFNKESGEPSISQMAGSIAIPAACETVMTVRKHDGDSSMVYHTKSTMASTVPPFIMKISDMNEVKTAIKVEAF